MYSRFIVNFCLYLILREKEIGPSFVELRSYTFLHRLIVALEVSPRLRFALLEHFEGLLPVLREIEVPGRVLCIVRPQIA